MPRDRAYYRRQRRRAIARKLGILKRLGGAENVENWAGSSPGRLAKGKIHCSCWMCRTKSYDRLSKPDLNRRLDGLQQLQSYRDVTE